MFSAPKQETVEGVGAGVGGLGGTGGTGGTGVVGIGLGFSSPQFVLHAIEKSLKSPKSETLSK